VNIESDECARLSHISISCVVIRAGPESARECTNTRGSVAQRRSANGYITYDIHVSLASPIALEALERIGRLYKIEEEIRGRAPDERQAVRQARAGAELESLHKWLRKTVTTGGW
jgi:hypothetical protein